MTGLRYDPAMTPHPQRAHRVVSLVGERVAMFELAVPCEVFGLDRSYLHDPWYEHVVCTAHPGPKDADNGVRILVEHGLEALDDADTVVIPGWDDSGYPDEVLDALRRADARGARLLSVCTGAFLLAAAGLLDGKRATTHWMQAERLATEFPSVCVDPKVLYVEEGRIMTSAGTAAGIDLCLHVLRLDLGADVANAVARRMVVPPHRDGGQAQFVQAPVPCCDDDPITEVLVWAQEHLDEPLSVEQLARRANQSPRTFARRFRAATGTTPLQWLLGQRILLAQRLLETTDDAVELIATRCGFGSAATLRLHFQRVVAASPLAYRRAFRVADKASA